MFEETTIAVQEPLAIVSFQPSSCFESQGASRARGHMLLSSNSSKYLPSVNDAPQFTKTYSREYNSNFQEVSLVPR